MTVRSMSGVFDSDGFSYLLDEIDSRESTVIKETNIAEAECMCPGLNLPLYG